LADNLQSGSDKTLANESIGGFSISADNLFEHAFSQSEAALRSLTDSAPFSIIRYNREGRITYVNAPLLAYFGIPLAELIGKLPREVWPDGHFAEIDRGIAQVLKMKEMAIVEFSELSAEGKPLHHQVWVVPEKDSSNEMVGIIAFGLDITERRLAEREARLLNCALDNSFDATYLFDTYLRFRYVNEAAVRVLGYSREELLSLTLLDIAPDITLEIVHSLMKQTAVTGRFPGVVESRHRRKNGDFFPVEVGTSTFIHEGETLFLTVVRDITERKKIEQALIQKESELRSVLESSPETIIRYDIKGRMAYLNEKLQNNLGVASSEVMGKSPHEVWTDGRFDKLVQTVFQVMETKQEAITEVKRVVNGETKIQEILFAPEWNACGEINGVIGFGRDITEVRRIEKAIEDSRVQMRGLMAHRERAREEERKLIAREVHDELGQILSGLQLNIALVADKCAAYSEALREHFQESAILINQAIGVARNVASTLRPVELDMGIAPSLEWLVNRFATYTGIKCEVQVEELDHELGEASSVAFFRIVQESLTNVARHAKATMLSITLKQEGDDSVLKVCDNGVGFDMNEKKTNSFGLIGMQERVFLLGGSFSMHSRPGNGTEVVVRLPYNKEKP
jgi:PAS domain S-box-containing protein